MAKYQGTYKCGQEGVVNVGGPGKDREWKKELHFSRLCPECYAKKLAEDREKENKAAAEASKKMELPELSGSPKQVAWANTLRLSWIKEHESLIGRVHESIEKGQKVVIKDYEPEITEEKLIKAMELLKRKKTEARFWIESRNNYTAFFMNEADKLDIPEDVQEEINMEEARLTVQPDSPSKEGIVKIFASEKNISTIYVKDEDFMKIVKELNYKWNGAWERNLSELTGTAENRAAELGNKLLSSGFTVQFPSEASKNMAILGDFEPECYRWVQYSKDLSKLFVKWWEKNDSLYYSSKKLPGAKWYRGSMLVSPEFYKEVLDFAETWGFKLTKAAQRAIAAYQEKEKLFVKAEVSEAPETESVSGNDKLREQLEKAGVIEDLKDEA